MAGNLILENLTFEKEDSLIKALEKLLIHIDNIQNYL
jgi:hypothetical protein